MRKEEEILNPFIKGEINRDYDKEKRDYSTVSITTVLKAIRVALKPINEIIKKLNAIKKDEKGFTTSYWDTIFFSTTGKNEICVHISEIKFKELNPADLVRCLEYVIRQQEWVLDQKFKKDINEIYGTYCKRK